MVDTRIRLIIFFAAKDGKALYSQKKKKKKTSGWLTQISQIQTEIEESGENH